MTERSSSGSPLREGTDGVSSCGGSNEVAREQCHGRWALTTVWSPLSYPNECAPCNNGAKSGGTASSRPDGNEGTFLFAKKMKEI